MTARKDVKAAARTVAELPSELNDDSLELILSCFKCLSESLLHRDLGLVRSLHVFIIRLAEGNHCKKAIDALCVAHKMLLNIICGLGKPPPPLETLLAGVPYDDQALNPALGSLVVAHHFLLLQALLQYTSRNIERVCRNGDDVVTMADYQSIPALFLSDSNFSRWMVAASLSKPENKARYTRNKIKLLKGYVKVFDHMARTSKPLRNVRSCLIVKLIEESEVVEHVGKVRDHEMLHHYLTDLQELCPEHANIVRQHLSSLPPALPFDCKDTAEIRTIVAAFVRDPTSKGIAYIAAKLNAADGRSAKAVLQTLQKVNESLSESAPRQCALFALEIVNYLQKITQSILVLSSIHESIIDKILLLLEINSEAEPVIKALSCIFAIVSPRKQLMRMRNVSHILYNLGNKSFNIKAWRLLVEIESEIHSLVPNDENMECWQTKALRIAHATNKKRDLAHESASILLPLLLAKDLKVSANAFLLKSLAEPTLVEVIAESLSADHRNARIFSQLSSNFACILIVNVMHARNQPSSAAMAIMSHIEFGDAVLTQIFWYNYLQTGMDPRTVPRIRGNDLLEAGILLWQCIRGSWDDEGIQACSQLLKRWLNMPVQTNYAGMELEILRAYIKYLRFNGCNGHVVSLIRLYLQARSPQDPTICFFVWHELCLALLNLGVYSDLLVELTQFANWLKTSQISCVRKVIRFNLLQLRYYTDTGNYSAARPKFLKVLNVLESRPEFQLHLGAKEKLNDRFESLAILADFNLTAASLSYASESQQDAFASGIRCLSLLKLLTKNVLALTCFFERQQLQWEIDAQLHGVYSFLLRITSHMGLSRDFKIYVEELRDFIGNNNDVAPIVTCIACFDLVVYYTLLGADNDAAKFLEKAQQMYSYSIVHKSKSVQYAHEQIQAMRLGELKPIALIPYLSIQDIPPSELEHVQFLRYTTTDLKYGSILSRMLSDIQQELTNVLAPPIASIPSVQALPTIVQDGSLDSSVLDLSSINRLSGCVNSLLELIRSKTSSMTASELRNATSLLNQCSCALSHMTIFKEGSNLLHELFYAQECARNMPLAFEKAVHKECLRPGDVLPRIKDVTPKPCFQDLSTDFNNTIDKVLPLTWAVVTVDLCPRTQHLMLSRKVKGEKPFFVRLPPPQYSDSRNTGFNQVSATFNEILKQLKVTTSGETTSKVTSRDQRKEWWKLRFSLDLRMEDVINDIEQKWLGAFKGIFDVFPDSDTHFFEFKREFQTLIAKHLPYRCNNPHVEYVCLHDNLLKLFYGLDTTENDLLDELMQYLIASLASHGEANYLKPTQYKQLKNGLCSLIAQYAHRRRKVNGHLLLVLGPDTAQLPWESLQALQSRSVTRCPSLHLLIDLLEQEKRLEISNRDSLYYLINPEGDLSRTETEFQEAFTLNFNWQGLIRTKPENEQALVNDVLQRKVFVYLGHGGCDQYMSSNSLFKACLPLQKRAPTAFLIGCSSGAVSVYGDLPPSANPFNWMNCGLSMVLANLWDVTDKDIDKFTQAVFSDWGLIGDRSHSTVAICPAISRGRTKCILRYLNGASPILYGLPMKLR